MPLNITSITPNAFGDGTQFTVAGTGFGTSQGTVKIGGVAQSVLSWSDTAITCTAVRGSQNMGAAILEVTQAAGANGTLLFGDDFDAGALVGWTSSGAQNGGTIGVVTDAAQNYGASPGALKFTHPAGFNGVAAWANKSVRSADTRELFIEFKAKMPGNKHGVKFCKVFGDQSSGYANCTFGLDYTGIDNGAMIGVGCGDGSSTTNDTVCNFRFTGLGASSIGRNASAPGFSLSAPQGANFSSTDWGTGWHSFRFRVKFNSGSSALDEVNDGEFDVWIDDKKYLEVRNCFNRHYSNGPIDKVQFFEWSQGTPPAFEVWYDEIRISTGGFYTPSGWVFEGLQSGLDGLTLNLAGSNTITWDAGGFARITYNTAVSAGIQWVFPDSSRSQVYAKFDVRRTFATKCTKMCKITSRGIINNTGTSNVTIGPSIGGYTGTTLGIQYGDNPAGDNDNAIGYKTDGTFGGGTTSGSFYREQPTLAHVHGSAAAQDTTGQWDTYEVFAKFNDAGARNGEFALRRNGVLLLHLTDVWNCAEGSDINHQIRRYVGLGEYSGQAGFYEDYRNFYVSYQRPPWLHTASALVFSDNFASGDLTRDVGTATWGSSNAGTGDSVTVQTGRGRYGGAGLQFTFSGGASGDDAWAEQRFDLGALYTELFIEFDLYVPNGAEAWGGAAYAHRDDTGPDNNKFFRLWGTDYANIEKIGASLWPSGGYSVIQGEWNLGGGIGSNGSAATSLIGVADLGTWMRIKIHVKAATATVNGTLRIWKNDTLVVDNLDTVNNYTAGEAHGYRYGYLLGWANSGFAATTHLIIDNVRIFAPPADTALVGGPALFALQADQTASGTVYANSAASRTTYDATRSYAGAQSLKVQLSLGQPPGVCGGSHSFGGRWRFGTTIPAGYSVWLRMRCYLPSTLPMGYNFGTGDTADAAACSKSADGSGTVKWLVLAPDTGTARLYTNLRLPRRALGLNNGFAMIAEPQNDGNFTDLAAVIPRDQWFSLQMQAYLSATTDAGFLRLWLNDTYIGQHNKKTLESAGYKLKEWGLGDYWNGVPWTDADPSRTDSLWIDDIIVATDYPGFGAPRGRDPAGRVYIPDSITVGDL